MDSYEILQQFITGSMNVNGARDALGNLCADVSSLHKLQEAARARYAIGFINRVLQYKCGDASPQDLCLNMRDTILVLGRLRMNPLLYDIAKSYGAPYGLVCEDGSNVSCIKQAPKWLSPQKYIDDVYSLSSDNGVTFEEPSTGDALLRQHTHFSKYRSFEQKLAVYTALRLPAGDTLLISLPTGGGKSLVTQMLASTSSGLTVVIVPTVALALDQFHAAESNLNEKKGIFCYRGKQSDSERVAIIKALKEEKAKLLFTSPEAIFKNSELFRLLEGAAGSGYLRNIVVDEAHVVPDWGVLFRPDFQVFSVILRKWRAISKDGLRTFLLSATLSDDVVTTLFSLFGVPGHNIQMRCDALRQEPRFYFYPARSKREQDEKTLEAIRLLPKPMVVYVLEPREATALKQQLTVLGYKNIPTFTGETGEETRDQILQAWKENGHDVIIATSAFGIGVDKPDVRTIIHACVPENLSRFYQEVGRGGRDRLPSLSVLIPYRGRSDGEGDLQRAYGMVNKSVLTVERIVSRWQGMLKSQSSFVEADQCVLDTSSTPPYMSMEEAEYAGNRNITWNINLLLFLYRTGFIDLTDVEYRPVNNKNAYFITAKLLHPEIMGDMERLGKALEEPRKKELDLQLHGYQIMRKLVQHPTSACWGRTFKTLFPLAEEVCNGCPADEDGRGTTDVAYKLRSDPDLSLAPGKPNPRLDRRIHTFTTMIVTRDREGPVVPKEIEQLCNGASLCGLGAIVLPQGMGPYGDFPGLTLTYPEFIFAAAHTPYLFADGVLCVFSDDNSSNQALLRSIDTLTKLQYKCLMYCNDTMPVYSMGKAAQECIDGYRVPLEKL